MRSGRILSATVAALLAAAPQAANPAPAAALEGRPFGVLLLGDGGDKDWKDSVAAISRRLSPGIPFEFAPGQADVKAVQSGVDRLLSARIKKLVVVPLYATSHSELMDETRFIFGIRENPSPEFFRASGARAGNTIVRRARTDKLPVVLTQALDDHPLVVEVLASRALSLSKHSSQEALVLVGSAPAAKEAAEEYRQTLSALAERVRAKGGFQTAQAALLGSNAWNQSDRQRHEEGLRKLVRELSRRQRVLVVPHALTGALAAREVRRALQGVFMRYQERGLLPDERMVRWVEETAQEGASLPGMRLFKDDGKPLPKPGNILPSRIPEVRR